MDGNTAIRSIRDAFQGRAYQTATVLFCILFGIAMIANNQLAGEASWFWYATLFHRGAKLYADLHLALQPLFILEMDVWMKLFGSKLLVTEIPSVFHLLILCLGLFLLLRESDWPDWQKAVVLVCAFVFWTMGYSYRFDDYHVTTESFILYSLVLLLQLAKSDKASRQFTLAVALGVLCGFTATTRLNDGTALLAATCICLIVLARKRKLAVCSLFVATAALTVLVVVKCTGDSFTVYLSNTLTRAVGSKGGTGSILADPFFLFINALHQLQDGKWTFLVTLAMIGGGVLMRLYWKRSVKNIVFMQFGIALAAFVFSPHRRRTQLMTAPELVIPVLIVTIYLISVVVFARYFIWKLRPGWEWDNREFLILVPLAELASVSTSAAANPISGYYAPVAMFLLLVPVILLIRRQITWANASFVSLLALCALTGAVSKVYHPYTWNNTHGSPMFVNRHWYQHPVYGPMYIESDWLQFNEAICADVGQGDSNKELLSLPFSFPNYFCATPPWHGYVQTFFDITQRSTIEKLIGELQAAPPQWIVYQRQLTNLTAHEQAFNHGQRLAQRDLDELLMQKIATGQWHLVDKKNYQIGDGWYVIRTRP